MMQAVLFILSLLIYEVSSTCAPKNVKFINFYTVVPRSRVFIVEASAEKCPGLVDLYFKWECVNRRTRETVKTARESVIRIDGYDIDSRIVFKDNFTLTVEVSHRQDMSASGSKTDHFQFRPDHISIKVKGGDQKNHPVKTDLIMDGKNLSRDPSFPLHEDTFQEGYNITWTVEPKIPGFTLPKKLVFTVPSSFLKLNDVYKFTVEVFRRKIPESIRFERASQTVTISPPNVAQLNLICVRNCLFPSPKEKTAFRVDCIKNCQNLTYTWSQNPPPSAGEIDFGDGFNELVIEPGGYKEENSVEITVKSGDATASYTLVFVKKMTKGSCTIEPKEGISGITVFKVKCEGFKSNYGNLLYTIYQNNDKTGKDILLAVGKTNLGNVLLSEGNPALITVKIQDTVYNVEEVKLNAVVKPFSPEKKVSKEIAIKYLILGESDSLTSSTLEENKDVQMASYLLDAIDSVSNMMDEVKMDLQKHIAESLEKVQVFDYTSAAQIISALTKLVAYKLANDTYTSRIVAKSTENAAKIAHDYITGRSEKEDPFLPLVFTLQITQQVCDLTSKLIENVTSLDEVLEKETPVHDYDSYDDMESSKLFVRDNLRDVLQKATIAIQLFGICILHKNLPDERATVVPSELMNFNVRRVRLTKDLKNLTVTDISGSKVFIPKPLIEELRMKYNFIDYQFGVLKKNPFWWHQNISKFNTDVTLFSLFHKGIKLTTVKNPFYIHLKVKSIPMGEIKGNITNNTIIAHRIKVTPDSTLIVEFKTPTGDIEVVTSDCYCTKEDFEKGVIIRKNSSESERTFKAQPPDKKNVIYICVTTSEKSLSYEASFSSFSCQHWNLKTGNWDSDDCKIQDASIKIGSEIVCECLRASFYTGQILVPSNSLNLNLEIDISLHLIKNWLSSVFITSMLVISVIFLICAYYADKKHKKKNFICCLDDNVPGDSYVYLMVVATGFSIDAGTTADVAFQIIGEQASSRVHLLKSSEIQLLSRNSQDWVMVYTPSFLGDIKKIRLWHNCKGAKPHWYCSRILVQDLQSGMQYSFIVEEWLSVILGKGKVYHEVFVVDKTVSQYNKKLLKISIETQMKDDYIWLSVFTRDSQSNFSSLERAGVAVCTIFVSMLANGLFHGIPSNTPSDFIDKRTTFYLNSDDIVIFITSWLIAALIGLVILLIFRLSAPHVIHYPKVIRTPEIFTY